MSQDIFVGFWAAAGATQPFANVSDGSAGDHSQHAIAEAVGQGGIRFA